MAVAAATFWFTASTGTSRYSLTSQRLFSTCRRRQSVSFVPKFNAIKNAGNHQHNRRTSKKSPSFICKSDDEVMFKPWFWLYRNIAFWLLLLCVDYLHLFLPIRFWSMFSFLELPCVPEETWKTNVSLSACRQFCCFVGFSFCDGV